MNIHLVFCAYALSVTDLIESLIGSDTIFHCHLHSKVSEAVNSAHFLAEKYPSRFLLHDHGFNRGLSRSWNDGLIAAQDAGAEVMIILNDDIVANREDMLRIAQGSIDHREAYMVNGQGLHVTANQHAGLQLALAAINPIMIETVGYFDENLFPIYREDTDLYRRCILSGLQTYTVGETAIRHQGERTIQVNERAWRQVSIAVPRGEDYFRRKWGSLDSGEYYNIPFNDPRFDLKIRAEDRHAPYPGYDRQDYDEIVALDQEPTS